MENKQSVTNNHLIRGYLDEQNRFTRLPGKRKKKALDQMLQILASKFSPGVHYSEIEVNEILNKFHSFGDPATLRRLLYGTQRMDRTSDGRSYWLKEAV